MMASAALRAAGKEFESLYETIESHGGSQVYEEDDHEGWSSSEQEGAAASAVTLLHQWKLEQKALLDMKSLLSNAKSASSWPSRGASKKLDTQDPPKAPVLPRPDVALMQEATPAPAKKRKLPTPRKERSKQKEKSPAQEESTSSPKQKKGGAERAPPAGKPVAPREKDSEEPSPTKVAAEVVEVDEEEVEEVVMQEAEKAPTRSSRRAATAASPRQRSRGALTPSKRKASERNGGSRNSTSRSSSQRPARVTSKDFSPVPTVEMKSSSFPCPEGCGNSFGSISTRNCHLNVAHPDMASKHLPYSCNKCPYAAGSVKTIEAHMKSAHRGD